VVPAREGIDRTPRLPFNQCTTSMTMTQSLTDTIKRAMEPLTERFALLAKQESESTMVAEVLFANDTTAVRVTVDWGEFRPFVSLYQLERGQLPLSTSIALPLGGQLKDFDADTLLHLRAKGDSPSGQMFGERSPEGIYLLLRAY